MPRHKAKKTEQVNMRVTEPFAGRLARLAERETRDRSELARLLLEWAMAKFDQVGSLSALLNVQIGPSRPGGYDTFSSKMRASRELYEQLHVAVDMLLQEAPSATIEQMTEFLTTRAGKYSER